MQQDFSKRISSQGDSANAKRLERYLRRTACTAAAGLGAFGIGSESAEAGFVVVDPPDFGVQGQPFGWVAESLSYAGQSFGVDILQNGGALDVGFFRGGGYYGYLIARTDQVGYHYPYGNISGSGQLRLLNNSANPDGNGNPGNPLQGFNAGEVIGDGDPQAGSNTVMRLAYEGGDWDGVPNGSPSYIGFEIDIDNDTSFDGFGWIEVIVTDPGSNPDITVTRWAYTDDGSTIQAGQVPEPTSLALLAAGAGALAFRRKRN